MMRPGILVFILGTNTQYFAIKNDISFGFFHGYLLLQWGSLLMAFIINVFSQLLTLY
jgi:hypothetical protein